MKIKTLYSSDRYVKESQLDILVCSPHPDDAELSCGGSIAKMAAAGHRIGIVDFSLGEMGSRGSVEGRMMEAIEASKVLGIDARLNLCFPDSQIGVLEKEKQQESLVSLFRTIKPKTLLCPYGDNRNPDHFYIQRLIEDALFYANLLKKFPELGSPYQVPFVSYYMMRQVFTPSYITDISDFTEIKKKSIQAHKVQIGIEGSGHETLVSSPLLLPSIEARDKYYGAMIGVKAAEAFYLRGAVPIEDPHKHFLNLTTHKSFFSDR